MPETKKRFVFLVQGEGRGHMTQAIVLFNLLSSYGHRVDHVFIGKSARRKIPGYFFEKIQCPVEPLESPNFVLDKMNKSLLLAKTIKYNLTRLGAYWKSLKKIDAQVKALKPDALVNFYDFLGGFYFRFFSTHTKHICVGHQFLAGHPNFPFVKGRKAEKWLYLTNNKITSIKSFRKVALSFVPYHPLHYGQIRICPPLISDEILRQKAVSEPFILAYMVNDGYAEEVMAWHKKNPKTQIHCFWDRQGMPEEYSPWEHLVFHQIDNQKFIDFMRRCQGYISTAGFESICEAMALRKPVMMVPVAAQYEQACNAIDAEKAGAGISGEAFDVGLLLDYLPKHQGGNDAYARWIAQRDVLILEAFTNF